jgi:hypothetical protein
MPVVTLKTIGQRALQDREFFDALVKDVASTLKRYDLAVSDDDLDQLKDAVKQPYGSGRFTLVEFIRKVHDTGSSKLFAPWDSDWLDQWWPIRPPHR